MKSIRSKILNITELCKLVRENEILKDEREKEIRGQLIDDIWVKITDYDIHILNYKYRQHVQELSERGVEFLPAEKSLVALQWDELFGKMVTKQSKRQTEQYSDQYKWHIFSFELLCALKSTDAKTAFDRQAKDTVYLFFQDTPEAYLVKNAALLKADDFDIDGTMGRSDLYIFDPVEKWTYVKTHESMCGPYFYPIT